MGEIRRHQSRSGAGSDRTLVVKAARSRLREERRNRGPILLDFRRLALEHPIRQPAILERDPIRLKHTLSS